MIGSTDFSCNSPDSVIHSKAFFKTARMLWRYSGVEVMTASASATCVFKRALNVLPLV